MLLKSFSLVLLLITSLNFAKAQDSTNTQNHPFALSLDIVGRSGFFSINAEYSLAKSDNYTLSGKIGFGYIPIDAWTPLTIPLSIAYIKGKTYHHIEAGLGATYLQGNQAIEMTNTDGSKSYYAERAIYLSPFIGYRFDKLNKKGLIIEVYYSPLIPIINLFDEEKLSKEQFEGLPLNNFTNTIIPTPEFKPLYFGGSIGYRF